MNRKKIIRNIILSIIAILLIISILIGISYAYWLSKVTQSTVNTVNSDCLNITLTDKNPIELENAYPISDSDAAKLTPYTFTITNTCNLSVTYDVTLEIMQDDKRLASEFIALQIDDEAKRLLSKYKEVTPTYSDDEYTSVEARELKTGTLDGGESVTYNMRLWMDESVTSEDSMNKNFLSKISVVATRKEESKTTSLADYIQTLASTDTTDLVYDDTSDKNLRYIGGEPTNCLCFDENCTNGVWRVIGVMNNIETATHGTQSLVKIVREEEVENIYRWDDSYNEDYAKDNNVNYYEAGNNDWTTAKLQTNLNSGEIYTTYIKDYVDLFETVTWNLGGVSDDEKLTAVASKYYVLERGTMVYSGRPTTWVGKIGLIYPSDYGYATSGGSTTDRETCLSTALYSWDNRDLTECKFNDYLILGYNKWTLTPSSSYSYVVFEISSSGNAYGYFTNGYFGVNPVGYLVSNTKILSGNGSISSPWIIGA